MSREAKIIIFGLILLFSFYLKWCDREDGDTKRFSETDSYNTLPKRKNVPKRKNIPRRNTNKNYNNSNQFKDCIDLNPPKNGYSPYDSYFGKGKYNYNADNTITVNTPIKSNIVFLLKDVYSGKTIRNEFIRKNSTFKLTNIPYGTYEFSYFSGQDWDDNIYVNNGKVKGGFTCKKSFSKSEKFSDRMDFPEGYYGGFELTLTQVAGGNLETENINEDEFFE